MNDRIWYFAGSPPAHVERGYYVVTNSDARLEVFAFGSDRTLWWAFQDAQVDGGFVGNLSGWFRSAIHYRIIFFLPWLWE